MSRRANRVNSVKNHDYAKLARWRNDAERRKEQISFRVGSWLSHCDLVRIVVVAAAEWAVRAHRALQPPRLGARLALGRFERSARAAAAPPLAVAPVG